MRPVSAERDLGAKRAAGQRERKGSERRKVLRSKPGGRPKAEFPERPLRGRLPTLRWCPSARFLMSILAVESSRAGGVLLPVKLLL